MYRLQLVPSAQKDLESLDPPIQSRIVKRLRWLRDNFEQIQPLPLTGRLSGSYKLRVGDYRVLYKADKEHRVLHVFGIGHRREVDHSR